MKAFLYSTILTWKMNLRNKDILIMYYIVPMVFYLFMGGIFTSIMPEMKQSLIQAMSVFGISMGAYLGGPMGPAQVFGTDIRKAYKVGMIPGWTEAVVNILSGTIHLFLMQLLILFTAPMAFNAVRPDRRISGWHVVFYYNLHAGRNGTGTAGSEAVSIDDVFTAAVPAFHYALRCYVPGRDDAGNAAEG